MTVWDLEDAEDILLLGNGVHYHYHDCIRCIIGVFMPPGGHDMRAHIPLNNCLLNEGPPGIYYPLPGNKPSKGAPKGLNVICGGVPMDVF